MKNIIKSIIIFCFLICLKLSLRGYDTRPIVSGTNTGDVTLDVVGSTPTAEGAILTGQVLQLQPADQSNAGLLSTGYQKITGNKQFDNIIYATNINATTGAGLTFRDNINNPIMKIDGTGNLNVGIGTTNPQSKLEVNGGILISGSTMYGTNSNTHINLGNTSITGTSGQNYSQITIGGGENNLAAQAYTTVSGGRENTASSSGSTVSGGIFNTASGAYSAVSGGASNTASGDYSYIFGRSMGLTAAADRSFVFGNSITTLSIPTPDVFLIYPNGSNGVAGAGNVGIGTTNPVATIDLGARTGHNLKFAGYIGPDNVNFLSWIGTSVVLNSVSDCVFNIDSNNNTNTEHFEVGKDRTGDTGGTSLFRVQEDGNVGIGLTNPSSKLHCDGNVKIGTGSAGVDYTIEFDGETNDGSIVYDTDNDLFLVDLLRAFTSKWYYCKYVDAINLAAGGSGATQTIPDANTLGGYQLDAATEYLYFSGKICTNWDASSDVEVIVFFECNVDNTGGNVTDTIDFSILSYFKGDSEVTNKTQTVEIATTVGQSPRYKLFYSLFSFDYDSGTNPIDIGDNFSFRINLETDTSEVDNAIIHFIILRYKTSKVQLEV